MRKAAKWIAVALGVLVLAGAVAAGLAHEPRPTGAEGPAADALGQRMEEAANVEAWERTGAVQWTFAKTHEHLWDRERHFARVRWDDVEALLRVGGPNGRAYRDGREVHGDEARAILEDAHARFINDSFWLNPIAKLRDPGVRLATVPLESGGDGLLVTYTSGGLTPGDAYLWVLGDDGLPRAWKLWVSIIPIGGVETTWEGWVTLSTGARISTRHEGPLGLALVLDEVEGATSLAELVPGRDPFSPLAE